MMNPEFIQNLIEDNITDCQAMVSGDDGTHFQAIIVSPEFINKSTVQQHQLVYQALGSKMGNEIHALSMQTYTPDEWQQKQNNTIS